MTASGTEATRELLGGMSACWGMNGRSAEVRRVTRSHAGLHADQARRRVGEPRFDLATGPPLSQHNRAAAIHADDVVVLTDIDTDHSNCSLD